MLFSILINRNKTENNWGPNAVFRFPQHGGTGGIWKKVRNRWFVLLFDLDVGDGVVVIGDSDGGFVDDIRKLEAASRRRVVF